MAPRPSRALLVGAALLGLLAGSQPVLGAPAGRFAVQTNSIRVTAPPQLAGTQLDSAIGDFGVPLYGGTMIGRLAYLPSNADGCKELGAGGLPAGADILLVRRGGCYFVEKAWHAQAAGARAVLVADDVDEALITMAVPEGEPEAAALVDRITIPTALLTKAAGDRLQQALEGGAAVTLELDWKECIVHPDNRVEWELWMSANPDCGRACASQRAFLAGFRDTAVGLEREGFTLFTPHTMLRTCSAGAACDDACIRHGRYCAADSVDPLYQGRYKGRQVAEANHRLLCAFRAANQSGEPWRWWDFATRSASTCTMAAGRFDAACAREALGAAGIAAGAVDACVGDPNADEPSELLEGELKAQGGSDAAGRVIILPTLVVNTNQYRGRLDVPGVLRALCSGFSEGTEPPLCLSGGLNVDDCSTGRDTCWKREVEGQQVSACVDTFRGYACRCPPGWQGDGFKCEDVDECALGLAACDQVCVNTPGSYRCECRRGYALHGGGGPAGAPGLCLPARFGATPLPGWLTALLAIASVCSLSAVGVLAYRWRMRREMQSEIRAIMREYMPLDSSDPELGRWLLPRSKPPPPRRASGRGAVCSAKDEEEEEEGGSGSGSDGGGRIPAAHARGAGHSPPALARGRPADEASTELATK